MAFPFAVMSVLAAPAPQALATLMMAAGAIAAHWNPGWSFHDRIAGTRIVPR